MNVRLGGFHCVGYVQSAHGISGELYFKLFIKQSDWKNGLKEIFLLPKGKEKASDFVIFLEFKFKPHKDGLIFKTSQIKDRNLAETFKGCGVYISEQALKAEPGEPIFLNEILNFSISDPTGNVLGTIEDFSTNGAQDLLVVRTLKNKEALVPLVEEFIVDVDFEKQNIFMDLPKGLLDLDALIAEPESEGLSALKNELRPNAKKQSAKKAIRK